MAWRVAYPAAPELPSLPSATVARRRLLRSALLAGLGAGAAGAIVALGRFLFAREIAPDSWHVSVGADDVPKPGDPPRYVQAGRFYVVNLHPGEGAYGDLQPAATKGGLAVLHHACTHLGCHLPWRPEFNFDGETGWFRCPCHGATYTRGGVRVFGPAPRDMDSRDFTVQRGGALRVNVRTLHRGACRTSPPC